MSKDQQSLLEVKIIGADVTIIDNQEIVQLYMIEDIYSWCKCGKLTIYDNRGFWEFLPLVGDEQLVISYNVDVAPGEKEWRTYYFKIFKVGAISDISSGTVGAQERKSRYGFEIFFIEQEFFKLHNPAYSRTWVDYRYYDIIKEIFDIHVGLNEFIIDEDAEEMIEFFSMSQRTPAEAIRWLGERMKGSMSGESGYLFFSNTKEDVLSYNICTLEHLLQDGEFIGDPGDPPGLYYMGGTKNPYFYNNIITMEVSPPDKTTINNLVRHVYLGYDIYRKYMVKREYDYFMSKDHYTCLGAFTLFNGDELISHMERGHETLIGEASDKYMKVECLLDNIYFGQWVKQYCLQQLVSIVVRGHVLRFAGGQIELNWLSYDKKDEKWNKMMLGRYLIKSVTHMWSSYSKPFYTQKLVLIKNGYWATDAAVTEAGKTKMEYQVVWEEIDDYEPETEQDITVKVDGQGNVRGL